MNPIQYDTKTFESALAEINSNSLLVDKPEWWKNCIAGIRDMLSLLNNAVANNSLLGTAFTQRNIELLLALIDYTLTGQTTGTGSAIFYLKSTTAFPITVTAVNQSALTPGTSIVASKRYEARTAANVAAVTDAFLAAAVNTGTDIITVTRDFTTGEKVIFTTTNTLPAPLALATEYWIIRVSATEIQVALTLADAYAGTEINLTTQGVGTHTANLYSFISTVYQQIQQDTKTVGTSDGSTEWQEFLMPDQNIILETLVITINSVNWTRVDTLIDSSGSDTHYRTFFDFDGNATIQFGNGTYGAVPGAFDVSATYATGGGAESNISTVDGLNIYAGSDSNINGVSNPAALTGGAAVENTENAKRLGPALLKARNRFVTASDGESLATGYSGISLAKVNENEFGVLSAQVICIANGGGNPAGAVKTALQAYLIDRTVLESIDVRVEDTTITSTNVTSAAKMRSGYTYTGDIENYFRLAWKLWLSETGYQIQLDYLANGTASAITLINTIFSESFSATNQADFDQITILLQEVNFTPRAIGEDIRESDTFAYIENVTGIDYLTITVPAFPIVLGDSEITTDGVLTLTEIP